MSRSVCPRPDPVIPRSAAKAARLSSSSSASSHSSCTGAPIAFGASRSRSSGSSPAASPRLTNTISGLRVRSWNDRISFSSSGRRLSCRGDCPASRAAWTFRTMSSSAWSCSFSLAGLFRLSWAVSLSARLARMSRSANTSSSRNRVTWLAWLAPLNPSSTTRSPFASRRMPSRRGLSLRSSSMRPGVSRKAMAAYLVPFLGLKWAPSLSRRSSGTSAMAIWPCCTLAGSGAVSVSHWNTVLLPDAANPTSPTFISLPRHESEFRQPPRDHVRLPLVQQRPVHRTRSEVGHVLVAGQPVDRLLNDCRVAAEDRAVAGEQELRVVGQNAPQRLDEVRKLRPVVGVDHPDTRVLVDVVPAKEQVPHLERELPRRVARGVPDVQRQLSDGEGVALVEEAVDLDGRHRDVDSLGGNGGVGFDHVSPLDRRDAQRVGEHLGLEPRLGSLEALDVVRVCVGGDDRFALGQAEVHLPDQLDDIVHRFLEPDIDEDVVAVPAVEQVDVDPEPPAGLVVQLDDTGKEVLPALHGTGPSGRSRDGVMIAGRRPACLTSPSSPAPGLDTCAGRRRSGRPGPRPRAPPGLRPTACR